MKGSGSTVNPMYLHHDFIGAMTKAFKAEKDPYAILAVYVYVFCGLRINEICERFIITNKNGTRKASREYVRQKIVGLFQTIKELYRETLGGNYVAPSYRGGDEHGVGSKSGLSSDSQITLPSEEDIYGSEEDKKTYQQFKKKKPQKKKGSKSTK